MEFALRRLQVLANDSSLSIHNPILIYSFLALYGLLTVLILTYVHSRFRVAAKTLKVLQAEWTSAESAHATLVGTAQEQLAKLTVPAPPPAMTLPVTRTRPVGFDVRNQVVALAKRGIGIADIARNSGLHEGEVDVLLSMARLSKGN
jgi:hypothetical protein